MVMVLPAKALAGLNELIVGAGIAAKNHTEPSSLLSFGPPTTIVFPSALNATDAPNCASGAPSASVSLFPCCIQTSSAFLVYIHTAPGLLVAEVLSIGPPTMTLLPSALIEIAAP